MRIALISCLVGASMMLGSLAHADGDGNDPQSTAPLQPSPYDTNDVSSAPVTWGSTPTSPTPTPAATSTAQSTTAHEEVGGATVSFAIRNRAGSDIHHARVIMDGQVLAGALEGWAVTIPPGEHVFEFAAAGFVAQEHTVTIHAGMVAELLTVALAPVEAPEEDLAPPFKPAPRVADDVITHDSQAFVDPKTQSDPWMVTYITGGTAIVALGIGTALGVSSSNQLANLKATCAPNCTDSQVQSVKSDLVVADVALVVGVVSGSVALIWALTHPREPAHENKTSVGFTVHGLSGQF